ncbi:WecB/TagA/CpsF family glycosyltransferase [Mucilaginibacter sp. AW1-3]
MKQIVPAIIQTIPEENFSEYRLFNHTLNELPDKSSILVNTINQYSYCIANEDSDFKEALIKSDVLLPDGIGVVLAARLLTGEKMKKIAGADLHDHLLQKLNERSGSCFYLGASNATLKIITERMAVDYPKIKVGSYSPPFKPEFSDDDNKRMIDEVNAFKPDVLFVGMTAPKQEKWTYKHKDELQAKIICTVGAVFDFYAGTIERPGKIWIKFGCEWLGRLIHEPKRLWRRYLYFGPMFVWLVVKEKLRQFTLFKGIEAGIYALNPRGANLIR